jgi:hypothetical protein
MALTKPRASQIYDIDYKQATRVITTTNITLTGGAPNQVDGVNLSLDDRVLVIGQSTGSQNGIYFVDVVGTGSNGTWIRSGDTDVTGELLAGTIVMVTEGVIYADTQWKLTTDNPIIIDTTVLTFEQNSAFAFGNVYANNTAVLATSVGDSLTLTAGNNISITGNNTSKTVSIGVTGISLNSISNGTSNVNVVSPDGNVTVSVAGTSNVAVFANDGAYFNGNLVPATSNIYSLGSSTNRWANLWLTGNTIYLGNSIIESAPDGSAVQILTVSATLANIVAGNVDTPGLISATGNVTGGNLFTTGTANIGTLAITGSTTLGGNTTITGHVLPSANITYDLGSPTQRWRSMYVGANTIDIGGATISANIAAGALVLTGPDGAEFFLTGTNTLNAVGHFGMIEISNTMSSHNTTSGALTVAGGAGIGGNVNVGGIVSVTGNITGGNILGNGYNLTGINAFSTVSVTGGNSAVADSISDTLTLSAGSGIILMMDSSTDTLTIAASSGSEIFVDGADFGTITEIVTLTDDLGLVTDTITQEADLGALVISGLIYPDQFVLPGYTTSTLPSASIVGSMIFVTNESGGSVPAFADGTNWRRVTDRAIVT